MLMAVGMMLVPLAAVVMTQASSLNAPGGLLFLNTPEVEIIPKGAMISRLSLGLDRKGSTALIVNTGIRPFTGVAHMTRSVNAVIDNAAMPLFTQEDIFTSHGREAVIHETVYSDDEKIYERRMARLSQNHAAAGTQPVFYGPAAGGTAVASDLSVVPATEDAGVTARRNARLAQLQSVAAAHGTAMPAIRSDASSTAASAGLFSRSLQTVLMALGPATDGQVLGYQNGRLVWIDIDQAYSSLHPVSSGRMPYVQPADGSPVERHYGGGGSQPSASTATSGGSQRDFGGQPINLGSEVTGVLSVGRGGTGLGSIGSGSLLVGNAAGTFMDFGIGTNGQVLTVTPTGGLMWSSVSVTGLSQLYADTHYVKQTGDTMTGGLTINLKSGSLGLNIVQTASGAYLHAEKGLSSSGALAVAGTALLKNDTTVRGTLSGAALRIMGSAGFSGTTVFTKDVRFNSTLTINGQTYSFAGSQTPNGYLKTDGAGNLTWATVSGGAGTFSSGNVLTLGDARYIRKAGGTMTGSLTIDLTSGFLGLNVRQTLSGAYLFAQKGLSTSGSLIAGGNVAARGSLSGANLTVQSGDSYILGRLGVGKISPQTKLDVVGTISGSSLKISGLISGSGGILVQGNATFRGTLSGSLLTVSSLKNCAVLVTNANGSLSCGTATPSFSSGNVVTIGDSRYLRTAGGTMTGNLTVRAAISGSSLNISGNITSSGTLVSRGSITTRGSLSGALLTLSGLRNCDTIDTDSNGNLVCGTDNTASAGLDMGTADNRYIRKAGGTMTGSLTIDLTSGFLGLNVRQTLSGAYLFAQKGLSTSGSLIASGNVAARGTLSGGLLTIMNGNSYIQNGSLSIGKTSVSAGTKLDVVGTISGSALKISGLISGSGGMILKGALMFQNFGNCTLKTDGNGNVTCGTDLTGGGAGTFGSGNVVTIGDSRYLRTAGGTMTGNLTVRAAISGSSLNISGNITNSGSIVTKNSIITKSIFSGAGLLLNGNAMIRGTMSGRSLTVTGTGSRPLLTTDTTTNTLLIGSGSTSLAVTSTGAMTPNLYTGISYPSGYIGSGATSITPYVMKLQGRLAYIANFNQSSGLQPKLEIYDISVPQSPVRLSSTAFGSANQAVSSLIVSGHYAYLSNFQNNQIYVFDVSSPTVPFLIANIAGAADEVQGRYLFGVVPSSGTLTAYDISNPSSIVAVGTAGFSNSTQTSYMAAQGRYLYVSNGTCCTAAFSVFDISNPSNMVKVGTISSSISANVSALVAQGRYVYLASGVSSTVQIIDVSTPSSPTLVKTLAVGSGNNGRRRLSLQGRYLYVTDLSGVVSVVDISNPRVAKTVGTIPYVGTINDVSVQGRYLYALNGSKNAINTFDIGGTYIQQLEVGGIETSQLVVRGNAAVFGELNVAGGASFGRGIYVQGQSAIVNTSTGSNAFTVISAYSGALRIAARGTTNTAHIMFGTGTTYDVQLRRPTGNALQTNANLYAASLSGTQLLIRGSMSGSSLNISGNITNSGSIVTKGGITTKGSFSGKSLTISGTGGSPLMATDIRYGTIIMGSGAMRNSTGAITPQLYVAGRSPGTWIGTGATIAGVQAIAIQGRYVYVNSIISQMQIFNVSNPQKVIALSTLTTGGAENAITVQGRYAYTVGSSQLRVIDVSNPIAPFTVSTTSIGGSSSQVIVQGRYAYLSLGTTFVVYDVSNPAVPLRVGGTTFASSVTKIASNGRYVYGASSTQLFAVDINNPTNPAVVSTTSLFSASGIYGVVIQNRYLYVINDNTRLQIVDISNAASPSVTSTTNIGVTCNTPSIQGRYLYCGVSGGVRVFDVSNTSAVSQVGSMTTGAGGDVMAIQGRYAMVIAPTSRALNTFDLGGAYIQQLEVGGLEVTDLAVAGTARIFGGMDVRGGATFGVGFNAMGPSVIYSTSATGTGTTGLGIFSNTGALRIASRGKLGAFHVQFGTGTTFDVNLYRPTGNALQTNANFYAGSFSGSVLTVTGTGSQPLEKTDNRYGTIMMGTGAMRNGTGAMAPQLYVTSRMPARFAGSGATQANPAAIAVQGRYAYVVNYTANSFQIFDVSTRQPQLVSTTTSGINGPYGVLVQGRYAYVQNYTGTSNVRIYDVSNPSSPVAMGSVIAGGTQANFAIQGRYLYSQTFHSGVFRVTDISNPSAPFVVGSLTFGKYGGGVTVSGRYAYVSNSFGTAATYVVDVSNPATPFTAATISTAFRYSQLKVVGKYLYLGATGGLGMKIYDISNPLSAVLVSTISGNAASFDVSGRYVYIANGSNSLQAYDISNPRVPVFAGATAFGALLQGISVQGRYAYTIDYTNSSINVTDLGGAYIQQLEAGGIEVGTLAVRGNATVYGSLDVIGAGVFGRGIHAQGPSMFNNSSTGAYTLSITSKSGAMLALGSGGAVVPTAALYIETKDSDNIEGIRIRSRETSATQDMFKIITDVSSTNNTVFRISGSGAVYADGVYNSAGADYAEWFASKDPDLMPGEVVCIDPLDDNTVKRCTRDADTNLMGIISTHPAYIGNRITGADGVMPPGYKLVGLIGQVPAKVTLENGPVHPGDSLTSASKPGFARRANAGESTVGVALEAFNGTSGPEAVINVLISRRNQSLTVEGVEQKVLDSIAAMKIEDQVNQMVGDTIRNFNLDDSVTAVVHDQLAALDVAAQVRQLIDQRLSSSGVTLSADGIANVMQKRYGLSANSGATVVTADMFLSGALKATSVTLANLRVEADAAILGTLHAAAIDASGSIVSRSLSVSAGATIQGGLRIDGPVATGSGFSLGSLTLSGSEVNIGSLLDHNSLKVIGGVTINGLAVFFGDVELKGELKLSSKQVGYAVIPQTGTSVTVLFSSGFTAKPIVTASPDYPVLYAVSKATATGFTIRIASPAPETVTFSWIAIPTDAPRTSSGTTMTGSFIAFPVDHAGVPVSTNAIWNACVRNQTILDTDGQPFSCSRYHTDAQWDHPDLHITFTWNGTSDPKILLLPVGYQAVVQEQGNALAVSSDSSSEQSDNSFVSEESSSGSSESNSESSVTSSSSSSEESSSSSESSTSSSESSTSSSDSSSSSSEPNS